jgi:alkaline phosphatase
MAKAKIAAWMLALAALSAAAPAQTAKNVILFLGDAAGIPTLHGASVYGYNEPQKLFIQRMSHLALMETSPAGGWVTDSAAGMTAIVTGHKTHNGVISQSDSAVRRKKDGEPLKTILEYAEERGLSTGVISNSSVASATPAACYAHVNDRGKEGEIFAQILKPPFGDGIDLVIGPDREEILEATKALGVDIEAGLRARGYGVYDSLDAIPADAGRVVALFNDEEFDLDRATQQAIQILSRNPKGYFLMVESNLHVEDILEGLERAVAFDRAIENTARRVKADETLILFTADHSYDFRIHDGGRDEPLFTAEEMPRLRAMSEQDEDSIRLENVRRDDDHTGEPVLLVAQGPGAERVKGALSNTDVFHIMMAAYGWTK